MRWTEPTGEPRASRISKLTQETVPYTAESGRDSYISCRKSNQHSQGITFLPFLGLTFWCPRLSTFPRDTQSHQHFQPCCLQHRRGAHPSMHPPE